MAFTTEILSKVLSSRKAVAFIDVKNYVKYIVISSSCFGLRSALNAK